MCFNKCMNLIICLYCSCSKTAWWTMNYIFRVWNSPFFMLYGFTFHTCPILSKWYGSWSSFTIRQIRTDRKHESRSVSTRKRNRWSPIADACCPDLPTVRRIVPFVRLVRRFTIRQIRIRSVKWLYAVRTKRTIREHDLQIVNLYNNLKHDI